MPSALNAQTPYQIPLPVSIANGGTGVNNAFANASFATSGNLGFNQTTIIAAAYTALVTDRTILVDATSNAVVITLPPAATSSRIEYFIKKIDASANTVTIKGNGSEVIINTTAAGANTLVISSTGSAFTIYCNGTAWYVF